MDIAEFMDRLTATFDIDTLFEMEKFLDEFEAKAYDEGYSAGYSDGERDGYDSGYNEGVAEAEYERSAEN